MGELKRSDMFDSVKPASEVIGDDEKVHYVMSNYQHGFKMPSKIIERR